jgi:uncharacterized protein (DUF2141 family)
MHRALTPLLCCALALLFTGRLNAQLAATCTLTVHVGGIQNAKGNILVALHKDSNTVIDSRVVEIDSKTMTAKAVFEKVPEGIYGVSVVHDENKSGQIDMDPGGMPLEGYGFSNNPAKQMGPPPFDEFKFELKQPEKSLDISLIYWP